MDRGALAKSPNFHFHFHPGGQLFILLMFPFVMQILFSLILSHVLIFASVSFVFVVRLKSHHPGLC